MVCMFCDEYQMLSSKQDMLIIVINVIVDWGETQERKMADQIARVIDKER